MENEKHDQCSTKETKMGKRKECPIPDEQRCQRTDGTRRWRCTNARFNHLYCRHHIDLASRNYLIKKGRRKHKYSKESEAAKDCRAFPTQKGSNQAVGMSKRVMENKCRIRNPEIAWKISVPSDISDMSELLPTLLMKAWNEELTSEERNSLRGLLPEGHKGNESVMSILSGGTSRLGIDNVGNWSRSVCEGKYNPDKMLRREKKLKFLQCQYFNDLELYHKSLIADLEWFKRLWSDTCMGDDEIFSELLEAEFK